MQVNTMYVYYGKDNLPYKDKERQVHFPIVGNAFEGASNTTKIRFFIEQIGEVDANWIAIAKLPNGKIGSQILSTYYDYQIGEWYAEMSLSQFYTQHKGDVYISLNGYTKGSITYNDETGLYETEGNPIVQATGSIKLAINYATQYVGSEVEEDITLEDIMEEIGNKLNKNSPMYIKVVSDIANINTSAYENYLTGADIVYDKSSELYYSLSGEYPTLVATPFTKFIALTSFPTTLTQAQLEQILYKDYSIIYGYMVFRKSEEFANDFYMETGVFSGSTDANVFYVNKGSRITIVKNTRVATLTNGSLYYAYTKGKIDSLLSDIKTNSFKKVDLTTYPTLESFLASSGEEGIIYLYPVDTSESPTFESGFYEYIWEDNGWLSIGSTEIDIGNFYTKQEIDSFLSDKENVSNKTTELSISSTNTQYPSAKAVYDKYNELREIAQGRCKTIIISYQQALLTQEEYGTTQDKYYFLPNGEILDTYQDFLDYVGNDTYGNTSFNSQNNYISFNHKYIIDIKNVIYDLYGDANDGDIILVIETDVPDRWVSRSDTRAYKLETSKIDLSNYYDKSHNIVPLSDDYYSIGAPSTEFLEIYTGYLFVNKDIKLENSGVSQTPRLSFVLNDTYYPFDININLIKSVSIEPKENNTYDLGNASYTWKDLYLGGTIYLNEHTAIKSTLDYELNVVNAHIRSNANGSFDIGGTNNKWRDIWFDRYLKGGATLTQAQYDALVSGGTVDSDTFYFIEEE